VPRHGAGGDVPRVVGVFWRDDALREIGGGELIHFLGDIEDVLGSEGTLEQVANALGCLGQFFGGDQRGEEAPLARLHLPPKLLGGVFLFVVEVAAEHGGIEVEAGHGHGASIADIGWKSSRGLHRTAHQGAALGDVFTVADLFAKVLRPIAEQRGLATWEQLTAYAGEEWYPSRIAFGKHKGKSIAEACNDAELRGWLDGLARSANARNARMGRWYLRYIEETAEPSLFVAWECARDPAAGAVAGQDLVLYVNPELPRLRALVDAARARLAELEAGFTVEKAKVEAMA